MLLKKVFYILSFLISMAVASYGASVMVATGSGHVVALKEDGTVLSWGENEFGQLGIGSTTDKTNPTLLSSISDVIYVATGKNHTIALKSDGTLMSWGDNIGGQLGDNSNTQRNSPVAVVDSAGNPISGISSISAGDYHTLALTTDGKILAWGQNSRGQLGDGGNTSVKTAVYVKDANGDPLEGISAISASRLHSMALKDDGTVLAWGYNVYGQLGNNSTVDSSIPVAVVDSSNTPISNIVAISSGYDYNMALSSDGNVFVWGDNTYSQLGLPTTTVNSPTAHIVDDSNSVFGTLSAISAGATHVFTLKDDTSLVSWGDNGYGQLSDLTNINSATPNYSKDESANTLSDIKYVSAGNFFTVAIKSDGSLLSWGRNNSGQLGNGTKTNINMPTQVIYSDGALVKLNDEVVPETPEEDPEEPEEPEEGETTGVLTYSGDLFIGQVITLTLEQTEINGNPISTYLLDIGDGVYVKVKPDGSSFKHTYLIPGTKNIKLKIISSKKEEQIHVLTLNIEDLTPEQKNAYYLEAKQYCVDNKPMCLNPDLVTTDEFLAQSNFSETGNDIIRALDTQDTQAVVSLYNDYKFIEYPAKNGVTPLHTAIKKKDVATAQALISKGANINAQDIKKGETPLHYAVAAKQYGLITELVNAGANVHLEEYKKGLNPIYLAISKGSEEALQAFLDAGFDINTIFADGNTALHYAAISKKLKKLYQFFIDNGANINSRNTQGQTVMHLLISKGDIKTLELLGNLVDYEALDDNGQNGINYYYFNKSANIKTKNFLISKGLLRAEYNNKKALLDEVENIKNIDINEVDSYGRTPLHYVVLNGDKKTITTLLENGANLEIADNDGNTPLLISGTTATAVKSLGTLLIEGANPNALNNNGQNILHLAAGSFIEHISDYDSKEIKKVYKLSSALKEFVKYDKKYLQTYTASLLEVKDNFGMAPILYAAKIDNDKFISDLLKAGADVNVTDNNGVSLLGYTYRYSTNYKAVKTVQKYNPTNFSATGDTWFWTTSNKFGKAFFKEGVSYSSLDNAGHFSIHYAAVIGKKGMGDLKKMVTKYGMSVDLQNIHNGMTPLHYMAQTGDFKSVEYLVEKLGADTTIQDNAGRTALYYAFISGNQETFEYLLNLVPAEL
jgi:alpha-tubulin suppressor-like RCC1 family protein/ankyrin repeat protein